MEQNKMTIASRTRSIAASALMATAIVATLAEPAFAQAAGIESILQNVVDMLTGNIFRLIATIAVIIIAIAWMFGYMDLRRAGYWIVGIGVIAGSSELVNTIVGS
jgi:type IV secretion system protein VirB2